jgi:integrase
MSKQINFTKSNIDSLPIPETGKRDTYHDTKNSGLQLRITSTGTKTFSVYKRVKGGSPERVTLGRYPDMTIEKARKEAANITLQMIAGKNPADRLREAKREMTLNDLFQEYMERKAAFNRRPDKPQATYRLYLSDWGKRKLSTIRHEEIDRLHKKIGRSIGKVTANIVLKLLHVMFNKAINEWRIWKGENPAHGIAKFSEQSRDRFLQSDELPRFFHAVAKEENETIRDYVLISLLTGARRSNVLAMQWKDINFDRAEWRIEVTKNGTPQIVTLTTEVIEILLNRKPLDSAVFVFPGPGKSGPFRRT